ncbi:MAG: hypothetical protein GC146_12640 [Limimaricola sp.]|uniref:prolyl hydroxylase family protein n=1 Tax=Limimaricola sp. TaxID=2211665 RepID=UPI001D730553|nr:2OG-Fe(II) oxygenase [Limimaricola sp.]MBI1418061.1 hypothetical protein [Limimaricola sp.]
MRATLLCANPVVAVHDEVFDAAAAAAAIAAGKDHLERAGVTTMTGAEISDVRSNRHARIDQWSVPELADLVLRVSSLVRMPPEHCEQAKLLHYTGTEKFDLHHDAYHGFNPGAAIELRNGGQRLFTTLCYLNNVEGGGETEFPELKIAVRPRLGRVLLFSNTTPGTVEQHPHAVHAGRPVTSGEKWVLSLWWREQIAHVYRDYPAEDGETQVF